MDTHRAEQVAEMLLSVNAISLNLQNPFTFVSGIKSPIYTDCRLLMSYPNERTIIRDFYIEAIQSVGKSFDVIAGTATAGIPHAAWISQEMQLPMVYVRSKPKDHGKGNQIEGIVKKGQRIAVIEDLISTGESSVACLEALRAAKTLADNIFAIFTYGMKKPQETFTIHNVTLVSLTNFETVIHVAKRLSKIKENDQPAILDWATDPQGWGKRMGFE